MSGTVRESRSSGPARGPKTCAAAFVSVALVLGVLSGCAEPLFAPDEPRSQYDATARLLERSAPPYLTDEYGAKQPNIRGRLLGAQ